MRELSIFIDESGDFGEYDYHSPYYIISMVFHNQETDISEPLEKLNTNLRNIDYPNHCIHTGPIIRRENEYEFESIENRRRIFNFMVRKQLHFRFVLKPILPFAFSLNRNDNVDYPQSGKNFSCSRA